MLDQWTLTWVDGEVLQLVNHSSAYFVGLNLGVNAITEKNNVEVEPAGGAITSIAERATLWRKIRNTGEGLLSGPLNPVLTEDSVWLILKELDDNRIVNNFEPLCKG